MLLTKTKKKNDRDLFELSVFDRAIYFTVVELVGPGKWKRQEFPLLKAAIAAVEELGVGCRVLIYAVDDRKHDFCLPKAEWPEFQARELRNKGKNEHAVWSTSHRLWLTGHQGF